MVSLPTRSTRMLVLATLAALGAAVASQVLLQRTFATVRHPSSLLVANLTFDPDTVRGWYRILDRQSTLQNLVRTETVDFAWIVALSLFIFLLTRLAGRLLARRNPHASRRLISFAPYAAAVVWLDGAENAFSLLMLSDPWAFHGWLSYLHAGTSWLKMAGLIAVAIGTPTYALASAVHTARSQLASADR